MNKTTKGRSYDVTIIDEWAVAPSPEEFFNSAVKKFTQKEDIIMDRKDQVEVPAFDVVETEGYVDVFIATLGFSKKDLTIKARDESLTITGERPLPFYFEEFDDSEVHDQHIVHQIKLNARIYWCASIDVDSAKVKYENGITHIRMKKQNPDTVKIL